MSSDFSDAKNEGQSAILAEHRKKENAKIASCIPGMTAEAFKLHPESCESANYELHGQLRI